jgi:hypothetical protein
VLNVPFFTFCVSLLFALIALAVKLLINLIRFFLDLVSDYAWDFKRVLAAVEVVSTSRLVKSNIWNSFLFF